VEVDNSDMAAYRKHLPVYVRCSPTVPVLLEATTEARKFSRLVNIEEIDLEKLSEAELLIGEGKVDEGYEVLTNAIMAAVPEVPNKVWKKPKHWFDRECSDLRKNIRCLLEQKPLSPGLLVRLRENKKLFREKVAACQQKQKIEEESRRLAEAECLPWKLNPRRNGMFTCPIPLDNWKPHFSGLLNPGDAEVIDVVEEAWLQDDNVSIMLNKDFTLEEVGAAICQGKDKKAVGLDKIANEHLKGSFAVSGHIWVLLFNSILQTGRIVSCWSESIIKVLFKGKGDVMDPNAYRGIALLSHPFKLLTKLLANRIAEVADPRTIPGEQYGFRKGRSTGDAISVLRARVKECLAIPKKPLYAVFVDFRKAFDYVPRKLLIEKLVHYHGIRGKIVQVLANIYGHNKVRVDDGLLLSDAIQQRRGVLQGDSLSPLIFILFILRICLNY
jgi:hypothetical protein